MGEHENEKGKEKGISGVMGDAPVGPAAGASNLSSASSPVISVPQSHSSLLILQAWLARPFLCPDFPLSSFVTCPGTAIGLLLRVMPRDRLEFAILDELLGVLDP